MTRAHASRPPASLRAHELFCVGSTTCLRQAVQAAPRLALEQTMATPAETRCGCCPAGGTGDESPDTCAAYNLCRITARRQTCTSGSDLLRAARAAGLGRGGRGSRERGEERRRVRRGGGGGRQEGVGAGAAGEKGTEGRRGNEKGNLRARERRCWELQARFTRAAAELEFLGVARPVKRRKVEYMQRTAFPLDQLRGASR